MKTLTTIALFYLTSLFGVPVTALAQDNVTIPKTRLQELEQKERELNRLKGETTTNQQTAPLNHDQKSATKSATPVPEVVPSHTSPPIASLAPLKENEEVDAIDLANHYRSDPVTADARYLKHKFLLRGEIAGFEKPLLKRDYKILLRTADRDTRVICNFFPPEDFNAVFTTEHGSRLVASMGAKRVPLAKVGQLVVMRAECRGWKDSSVIISGGGLKALPAANAN